MKIDRFLAADKRRIWIAGIAILAIIAWVDHRTHIEYDFGHIYLLPIALVAWYGGFWRGILMSAGAAATWFAMDCIDYFSGGGNSAEFSVIVWDTLMSLGIFIIATAALAKIKEAMEQERSVAKLKGEMLSLVSHEFNNSLTSMGIALLMLKEEGGSPEALRKAYPALERIHLILKNTAGNFLNQARMQSGRFQLDIRQLELRRLVDESLSLMRPLSDQKGIDLRLDFPSQVFPVSADPDAMTLVLNNLIGNAIKYTPNQGRVAISLKTLGQPAREVEVSVEDSGIGIASKDHEAVFQGFYRTEEGKNAGKGYGVGLQVCKEIVATHESVLKVDSALGKGSRFSFALPVCSEDCPHRDAGRRHRCWRRNLRTKEDLSVGVLADGLSER